MQEHGFHLVSMRICADHAGAHELLFRLSSPPDGSLVRVFILQSAYRRLSEQLRMAGLFAPRVAEPSFLAEWGAWHMDRLFRPGAAIPPSVTITLGDVDAYGRYSRRVGQSLQAA